MLAKSLRASPFFQLLESREASEPNAKAYTGLLLLTEPDAEEALEYIKSVFPGFTSHGMGHSLRILENLYQALSDALREELSSPEIFCLIMAAMFHDMGMAKPDVPDLSRQRDQHHLYAEEPLKLFMEEKMTAVAEWRRLYSCILFVCQAHGMEQGAFYGHKDFYTKDTIDRKPLRFGLLGVLLRIGDLLDLDENRTSGLIRRLYPSRFQDETSQRHHCRHEHVARFSISPQTIEINVLAEDVEEYHIWDRWLHCLKEDILHANTYLMPKLGKGLNLPELRHEIQKTAQAAFETEELRFELTDEGRIWNILSQSVYTGEFDFIRELVQNGIDAVLMKYYQNPEIELAHPSPRSWGAWERDGKVVAAYSAEQQLLLIWDTGTGMDTGEVRQFLFRIADSGYRHQPGARNFPLHTIAKFGIGFLSCLSKCEETLLYTCPAPPKVGCRVRMYSNSTHAYFEKLDVQPVSGTMICMQLKRGYKAEEVREYLSLTFRYPSVPVEWLDLDQMERQVKGLSDMKRLRHRLFAPGYQMPQHLFERDYDFFEAVRANVFNERKDEERTIDRLNDVLKERLELWRGQEQSGTLKRKTFEQELSLLLREISLLDKYTDIRKRIGQMLSESKRWSAEEFSDMASTLLAQIQDCTNGLDLVKQQLYESAGLYMPPRRQVGRAELATPWEFDVCMIPFRGDFSVWTIVTEKERGKNYLSGSGLFFVQCAFDDWELGVEWRSIHGFLFQNKELTTHLAKVGEEECASAEEAYGIDLAEALDPAFLNLYTPEELLEEFLIQYNNQLGQEIVTSLHYLNMGRERITRSKKTWVERRTASEDWYIGSSTEEDPADYDFMGEDIVRLRLSNVPEAMAINDMIQTKTQLFQDGIPLNVDPSGLAPLGVCRVQLNLCGQARMELNVTRRYVDESQAKIDAWLAGVGLNIQRRILEQLNQAIRAWGFQGDLCALYTQKERPDQKEQSGEYFDQRGWQQMSALCNEISAESPETQNLYS